MARKGSKKQWFQSRRKLIIGVAAAIVVVILIVLSLVPKEAVYKKPGEMAPVPEVKMLFIETDYGTIEVEFYPKDAPRTVARIAELASSGFYNGLTFHRVVPGFVVQGGDPTGNGSGGSGKTLPPEFNKNKHVEGTVAMARAASPDSADSQFYICLGTFPHLDGQYTVFGQVSKGMEFVKKIGQGDKMNKVWVK